MLHVDSECERVVMSRRFSFHWVLIIADISTGSNPAFAISFGFYLAVHERAHSMVVKRVGLEQVDDVEAVGAACARVWQSEIVPLCEPPRIVVRLKNQVIFELIHLDCPTQVARFKSRLKHQSVIILETWLIVRCQVCVVVAVARRLLTRASILRFILTCCNCWLFRCSFVKLITVCRLSLCLLRLILIIIQLCWGCIHAIKHYSVHQIFLVRYSFSFSSEAFLEDIFLRTVKRF